MPGNEQKAAVVAMILLLPAIAAGGRDRRPPRITHRVCPEYKPGAPYEVVAKIRDRSALYEPKVIYRSGGPWRNRLMVADDDGVTHRARIPAGDLSGRLEYFIEVFDVRGNGPATAGTQDAPLSVRPSEAAVPCRESSLFGAAPESKPEPKPEPKPDPEPEPEPNFEPELEPKPEPSEIIAATAPTAPGPTDPGGEWCGGAFVCQPWFLSVAGGLLVAGTVAGVALALTGDASHPQTAHLSVSAPWPR